MALAKRSAAFSNGLDKKTDLPTGAFTHNATWQPSAKMRPLSLLRKKRFLLTLLSVSLIYLFIRYLPDDVPSVGQRIDSRTGRTQGYSLSRNRAASDQASLRDGEGQIYDGPVKFYHLAPSIRPHMQAYDAATDNVLFILYDLQVVSRFIPLACEMAIYNRSVVHVAVMAPQDNSIEEIMTINGIKQTKCPVFWHDARPDYNAQSSTSRRVIVLNAALSHLHAALRPTVAIIDRQQAEDSEFSHTLTSRLFSLGTPLATMPNDALQTMAWIATLPGRSLALLNLIRVDIHITPYKQSAGSLLKLLRSIENANYAGLLRPRIMIDLPQHVDQFALQYLEQFRWPQDEASGQSKLILRRRIDDAQIAPAVASMRTLESFYPTSQAVSHVLVLEPDVELSPDYLQYLMYMMLEYKYGASGLKMPSNMMGISLDLPEKTLDDSAAFHTPKASQFNSLFWSQSPSSVAMLYFGDRWIELQEWLSERLRHDPKLEKRITASPTVVSAKHPAWLVHAQELMHARNYYALYPGFATAADQRLVTVHDEGHQYPEEFAKQNEKKLQDWSKERLAISKGDVLDAVQASRETHNLAASSPVRSLPVLLLGKKAAGKRERLPQDFELQMYSSDGRGIDMVKSEADAKIFADRVSLGIGGCESLSDRDERLQDRVQYLFCDRDPTV